MSLKLFAPLTILAALATACSRAEQEAPAAPSCTGVVSGALSENFACDVRVTFDAGSTMTTVAITEAATDDTSSSQIALFPSNLGISSQPAPIAYSTGLADVVWAIAAATQGNTGYRASKSFPQVPDAGAITIRFSSISLTSTVNGISTYSTHGSFAATLPPIDPQGAGTVEIEGSF